MLSTRPLAQSSAVPPPPSEASPAGPAWLGVLLLPAAIVIGAWVGALWPAAGVWADTQVDGVVLALVFVLLFDLRLTPPRQWPGVRRHLPLLGWALLLNFALVPALGLALAWLCAAGQPLALVGLAIYFMAPCTDWFLGFTRLAGGNTTLGALLIPINLTLQLLLYPVYLGALLLVLPASVSPAAAPGAPTDAWHISQTLLQWFVQPLLAALLLRLLLAGLRRRGPESRPARLAAGLQAGVSAAMPAVLALLVGLIFAAHIGVLLAHPALFARVLLAVFAFFLLTYALGEGLARWRRLAQSDHVLLSMTTAARNAPLMLALTMAVLPGQPLVHAAIVIGMLVELPHLTLLSQLLRRRRTA